MTALRGENLTVLLRGRRLFAPLSLAVTGGSICLLMGPSGIGKSSLIGYLAGLPLEGLVGQGTLALDDKPLCNVPLERRRVGLLFQDDLLFPHLSIGDNLAFALPRGVPRAERQTRIARALAEADLAGMANEDPAVLSGGQRARVAMQRVLLSEPEYVLLDEPFNGLDQAMRQSFRDYVYDHIVARSLPCVLVTHDSGHGDHPAVTSTLVLEAEG